MKKNKFITNALFCGIILLLFHFTAVSQSSFRDSLNIVTKELTAYKTQMQELYEAFDDTNKYEACTENFDRNCMLIDNYFINNQDIIRKCPDLFNIWGDIETIRKKTNEKKELIPKEKEKQKKLTQLRAELELTLQQYKGIITQYQELDKIKRNPAHDTLQKLKNRNDVLYEKYSQLKMQNNELISDNHSVDSLCNLIEAAHKTISEAKDIKKINWGDIIFKVVIVGGLLFILINIIVSKKKLKKQLNGSKGKNIPTI